MATVWLTNSLYATPDTGPSSRHILHAVLPHRPLAGMQRDIMPFRLPKVRAAHDDGVEEDGEGEDEEDRENGDELIGAQPPTSRRPYAFHQEDEDDSDESEAPAVRTGPCHPYGIFFLRSIEFDSKNPIPAMSPSPHGILKESVFEYFAGQTYAAYVDFMYDGLLFKKNNPNRTRNKAKQRPHVPEPDAPIPLVFDLKNGGKEIRRPDWIGGEMQRGDGEDREMVTRNEFLSVIYHQLMVDAINKAPNPHGGDAYVKIKEKHMSRADVSIFKSNNPGASLWKARMRNGDAKDWELTFKHILPPKGSLKVGKTQNYPGCAYYKMWGHFMEEVGSDRAIAEAREAFKARLFGEVAWFPWAKAMRMWESSKKEYPNATPSPGLPSDTPAPHIILRKPCAWREDETWTPGGMAYVSNISRKPRPLYSPAEARRSPLR